jgi:hypothetical protein
MSYSRWSNGTWYVFWDSMYSGETKDSQSLACWYSMDDSEQISWSYKEVNSLIKESFDSIVSKIQIRYKNCSPDEATELQEYMQHWVSDVNKEFA